MQTKLAFIYWQQPHLQSFLFHHMTPVTSGITNTYNISLFSSLAFEMLSHPKDTNLLDYGRVAINRDWFHVLVHL
jgi:hypothetical protein